VCPVAPSGPATEILTLRVSKRRTTTRPIPSRISILGAHFLGPHSGWPIRGQRAATKMREALRRGHTHTYLL
jgi:hypothetical protein